MMEKPPKIDLNNKKLLHVITELKKSGLLQEIEENYLYWDKIKYKKSNYDPELLWSAVKFDRNLKRRVIRFGNYEFSYIITEQIQKQLYQFDQLFLGRVLENGEYSNEHNLFIEEAITSSQMEGASTTRKKAKEMILQEKRPIDLSEQMIMNNYLSMKYISENSLIDLTRSRILQLHKLVTDKTLEDSEYAGKFRISNDIYVVDNGENRVVYTPPKNDEIDRIVDDFITFYNSGESQFIHPIIKSIILHYMISWLHPFVDGNGRIARGIFYWQMLRNKYFFMEYLSISKIIKESKRQYEKAFLYSENDQNDLTYFIHYHIKVISKTIESYKSYLKRKERNKINLVQFMKIPLVNDRMAEIIKIIKEDPEKMLSIKEIETRFNVSNHTARSDMKKLVNLNLLEIIMIDGKKQNFVRSTNFDKILREYGL